MRPFIHQASAARVVFGAGALQQLGHEIERDIGMPADGLDRAADLTVQTPYPNPRQLDRAAIRALPQHAYESQRPD